MRYVDFLDTSGTLLGIVNSTGIIDEEGNFPGSTRADCVDALATMFGKNTVLILQLSIGGCVLEAWPT